MEDVPRPPCLVRGKDRNWTLRRRVPDDIRSVIGQTEIWVSYGPVSYAEARGRHSLEMAKIDARFRETRRRLAEQRAETASNLQPVARTIRPRVVTPPLSTLAAENLFEPTEADVRACVMAWFHSHERGSAAAYRRANNRVDYVAEEWLDALDEEEGVLADPRDERNQSDALAVLRGCLAERGFKLPSAPLLGLGTELIQRGFVESVRRARDRHLRRDEASYDPLFVGIFALGEVPPAPSPPRYKRITFEALLEQWAVERRPAPSTLHKYRAVLANFSRITGRKDVREITKADVTDFKVKRLALGRDPKTVENDIRTADAVLNWGVRNDIVPANPFAGMAPRPQPILGGSRDGYSDDQAARILTAARKETGWRRWVPWLLCFSGARIADILQLRRQDIRQEAGVWILNIRADVVRRVKNANAWRLLPIHPAVIQEGFLDYVKGMPDGPLFPEYKTSVATTMFGRWINKVLPDRGRRLVPSHSFRHRMEDELRKVRALPEVQDAITGRHNPRNAGAGYGRGFRGMPGEVLKELEKIPSPLATSSPRGEQPLPTN